MQLKNSIQIRLSSYDHIAIDRSSSAIQQAAFKAGAKVVGPIPMPNRISYCLVNRSPHVDKRSMDKFRIIQHVRVIKINELNAEGLSPVMAIKLPSESICPRSETRQGFCYCLENERFRTTQVKHHLTPEFVEIPQVKIQTFSY